MCGCSRGPKDTRVTTQCPHSISGTADHQQDNADTHLFIKRALVHDLFAVFKCFGEGGHGCGVRTTSWKSSTVSLQLLRWRPGSISSDVANLSGKGFSGFRHFSTNLNELVIFADLGMCVAASFFGLKNCTVP